jgi:hypothetical protein
LEILRNLTRLKKAYLRKHGKSGIEVIEEAFVLLRSCPPSILAAYYLGTVPFAAGFLVFISDLAGKPDAGQRLAGATLAMTALFIWMKFWQARFGNRLLGLLRGEPPDEWSAGRIFRSACIQTTAHAAGLLVLPLALIAMLPFAWVYAFFQNVSIMDDGRGRLRDVAGSSWKLATLWPAQNHVLLTVQSLFGFYVFLNWVTLVFLAPLLLRQFFGIESAFAHSPLSMLNTTFFAATAALGYLSVDPLVKACFVLRCFYGSSLQSGDDLRTEVRRSSRPAVTLAACLLLFAAAPCLTAAQPAPTPAVSAAELDRSINTIVQQEKYKWRNPPEKKVEEKKPGLFAGFLKSIFQMLSDVMDAIGAFLWKILKAIFHRNRQPAASPGLDIGWLTAQNVLLFALLALAAGGLAVTTMRIIRRRSSRVSSATSIVASAPDLEDENTSAADLPEGDWTRMGRELMENGELRPALRAFYLASLSLLASRELLTIARFKSNRDYVRELDRRGRALPELPGLFRENVGTFERSWYGLHQVNTDVLHHFIANLEKMRAMP